MLYVYSRRIVLSRRYHKFRQKDRPFDCRRYRFVVIAVKKHTHAAGTHIWMRGTLVFNPHALLDAMPRTEYTQVLESGTYLCIRYPQLRQLIADFKIVEQGITLLARQQERQRLAYHQINRLPPAARVAEFERKFRSFTHVASIQLRSMHVGLSRQTYSKSCPKSGIAPIPTYNPTLYQPLLSLFMLKVNRQNVKRLTFDRPRMAYLR